MSKYNVGSKTRLQEGLFEPKCYGDLFCKFRKIVGRTDFSERLKRIKGEVSRD